MNMRSLLGTTLLTAAIGAGSVWSAPQVQPAVPVPAPATTPVTAPAPVAAGAGADTVVNDNLPPAPKDPWKAWALGRFDRALEGFLNRQIARPEDAAAARNVAAARYRLGDFAGAAEALTEAAAKAEDPAVHERALYDLGNSAYRQGQLEESVKAYEAALAIDPEDEDARYNLEFVREEIRRRLEEAKQREQEQQQQQDQSEQEQQQDQQEQGDQSEEGQEQQQPEPQPGDEEQPPEPPEGEPQSEQQQGAAEPEEGELSPEQVEALLRSLEEGRPAETAPPKPGRRTRPAKDW